MKRFSVIIPNTDSILIGDILAALHNQTIDLTEGEILVVGSDKPGLVHPHLARFIPTDAGHSFATDKRNIGMRAAEGEVFLFHDDDCIPGPDWIERHLAWQVSGEKVVGGGVELARRNYIQLADNVSAFHMFLPYTKAGYYPYVCTSNLSVHRSIVEAAGEMLPHQNRADDLEWSLRIRKLGYRLYFDPAVVVLHDPQRLSLRSFWQHWMVDAPDTLRVRLKYAELLETPRPAGNRWMYLWGAPLIAAWATLRTFALPRTWMQYAHTLPLVYLSKMIWCWSAYRSFPSPEEVDNWQVA